MLSFLKEKGFLNAATSTGVTPLQEAAECDDVDIVTSLLEYGVNVDARDVNGRTALYKAVYFNHYEIVRLLLAHGAKQLPTQSGMTPLHEARSLRVAELLVEHGAAVDAVSDELETPLQDAAHYGHVDIVQFLISKGAQMNLSSNYGTAFDMAIANGRMNAAELLLANGCSCFVEKSTLDFLNNNIVDEAAEPRFLVPDLYLNFCWLVMDAAHIRENACNNNVNYFVNRMKRGDRFHWMQVLPFMSSPSKEELERWAKAKKRDMHFTYLFFQTSSELVYPGPVAECLKSFLLLPKRTRLMLYQL